MANLLVAGNSTNGGTAITTDTSGTLNIVTGSGSGSTAIAVDTSQNVGIGTTSPSYKLDVLTSSAGIAGERIQNSSSSSAAFSTLFFDNDSAGTKSAIVKNSSANTGNTGVASSFYMFYNDTGLSGIWNVSASAIQFGTSNTERMRIDSSGGLILAGSTAQKATGTTWSNPSDQRLKNNIRDYTKGTAELMQVRVKEWEYNGKGGTIDGTKGIGVIADEIMTVLPNTVENYNAKLNSDDEETTEIKKFDATEITWLLVKTVQELKAELDAVKAKVGA